MKSLKIAVENHTDGYVAYPVGIKGIVVGEGRTFDEALCDVQSALRFHTEIFGADSLEPEVPMLDALVDEAAVA